MKKLIIISVIFALMLAGGIWEILYTTAVYRDIEDGLVLVRESMEHDGDEKLSEQTHMLTEKAVAIWQKNKEILFCLGNHNVLRTVNEKLESLKAMVETDFVDDARVMVVVSISLIDGIANDAVPNITNMF